MGLVVDLDVVVAGQFLVVVVRVYALKFNLLACHK